MRAASPHSLSSCRLGNGKGGLAAGGKERRGTQTDHMTAPRLIISVLDIYRLFSDPERQYQSANEKPVFFSG